MSTLQRLRAEHAPAVLAFETANRTYFATTISDRGDEYFEHFTERHNALLAEQEAGRGAYYVLVAEDGAVLGRFNLTFVEDGAAELGYRVAQQVAGRGVASVTVCDVCSIAAARHEVSTLRAAVARDNVASQRVLLKAGFRRVGPAGPADLGGKHGSWYQRDIPDRTPATACHAIRHTIVGMSAPTPYLHFPGTARAALAFYGDVFGCAVQLHTFDEFDRSDGPADAVAHGYLAEGPVSLFVADIAGDEPAFSCEGMMLSLLGAARPSVLRTWFSRLCDGGRIVDDLQKRPWGATDGQVVDRYGLHWLIGFEGDEND